MSIDQTMATNSFCVEFQLGAVNTNWQLVTCMLC